ncbi:MAG: hypothetical protein H0X45_10400 [Planctomycetes bacterium]|nr:hypothetical protein [Planctomycetota bacterium]
MLVTDPAVSDVPDRLLMRPPGPTHLDLRVAVVRITEVDLPRLRRLQTRVAAILSALARADDAVVQLLDIVRRMAAAPGPLDDLRRFLPFVVTLARLRPGEAARFHRHMNEDPVMRNIFDEYLEKGLAQGMEKGLERGLERGLEQGRAEARRQLAEDMVARLYRMVERGALSVDDARAEFDDMLANGLIAHDLHRSLVERLG